MLHLKSVIINWTAKFNVYCDRIGPVHFILVCQTLFGDNFFHSFLFGGETYTIQYWSLFNWQNLRLRCGCVAVPVNWFFDIISLYFAKGQGPRRVIFGPVKSQNMTRRKKATSYYICNLRLTIVPNVHWKKSYCPFSWIFNTPNSGKKPEN